MRIDKMDYSKLIDLYLEGELNTIEKDLLFAELSRNPELREYFDQQIQFNQLFQKDFQTISPPIEATNYIFSSLNFKIPNSNFPHPHNVPTPFFLKFKQMLLKYLPFITSSVIGGLVSFVLIWFLIPRERTSAPVQSQNYTFTQENLPATQSNEIPKIVAGESKRNAIGIQNLESIIQSAFERWVNQYFAKSYPNNIMQNDTIPNSNTLSVTENSSIRNLSKEKDLWTLNPNLIPKAKHIPVFSNNNNVYQISDRSNFLLNQLGKISLSFRGYMMKSDPEVNVNANQTSLLNNAGVGIGYKIAENSSIGFEVGQEKFAQKFTLVRNEDKSFYKQNPLLWWYGIYYQQAFSQLFSMAALKPLAKLFIGGTPAGPLLRGSVGLQYTPDRRVSLFLGWEGSILWYKVQNNLYQTKKNGITYGVSVRY